MEPPQEPPPSLDTLSDDLHSISFNSTTTTTTTSTSSSTTTKDTHSHTVPSTQTLTLTLQDIHFLRKLGSGDIGSVYLAKLKPNPVSISSAVTSGGLFAAKVMDKKEVAIRNKEGRARMEKEILEMLDHPFLPKLFACLDSMKWSCLLTEFCPGGDLHVLRQRQPLKRFSESVVRFYASEVVVALEYLHMLGIVYRDLKPENVLVRADGHIMLTDFDLSLKCDLSMSTPAQVFPNQNGQNLALLTNLRPLDQPKFTAASCILPNCIVPSVSCFNPKFKRKKKPVSHNGPEFVAEPVVRGGAILIVVGGHAPNQVLADTQNT